MSAPVEMQSCKRLLRSTSHSVFSKADVTVFQPATYFFRPYKRDGPVLFPVHNSRSGMGDSHAYVEPHYSVRGGLI